MSRLTSSHTLGIDIGSMYIAMVELDHAGEIIHSAYQPHRGKIRSVVLDMQKQFDLHEIGRIAVIGGEHIFGRNVSNHDAQTSVIIASQHYYPNLRAILHVGAEKFQLIRFDTEGNYLYAATSTSCAAGTGSFLDQQALRLGLDDIQQLCDTALVHEGEMPTIASRCAVFAKTDLIHAQQSGYTLTAICNSLCKGLAKNIIDTLVRDDAVSTPIVFTGGVAQNAPVAGHLRQMLGADLIVHPSAHLFGSIGAALQAMSDSQLSFLFRLSSLEELFTTDHEEKLLVHAKLDWAGEDNQEVKYLLFDPAVSRHARKVEVERYRSMEPGSLPKVYLGIDIGSTSTKAILIDRAGEPLAGFYTYTSGKPLKATQAILEALNDFFVSARITPVFAGVGTTGSGRKFVGKIIAADHVVDEISSHARAAVALEPLTDTIIEIGGQDAKFTLLRDGHVTFAQMNTVCAAGTGSFIEEQALRLGVTLQDYAHMAKGVPSPLASDRCTVFMERDINQFLNRNYSVPEILSCVLYSVTENYLKKVATESAIGQHVCFQGATAKNRALVAAFEQRLGKKIFVSEYCHLTGALGVALITREEKQGRSSFRGVNLYKMDIGIRNETCSYCNNHCKISLAAVNGEEVAYGFLCGRDVHTPRFISKNNSGFDLVHQTGAIRNYPVHPKKRMIRIGLPAALYMFDELDFWKCFFAKLPVEIISSERYADAVRDGKRIAGAEFCAPVDAFYGHVQYLLERVDYVFTPIYTQSKETDNKRERYYCFYTQFLPNIVSGIRKGQYRDRLIMPFMNYTLGTEDALRELWRSLDQIVPGGISAEHIEQAYQAALGFQNDSRAALEQLFYRERISVNDISVVLLGRPYLVLSTAMNKGIPDIFGSLGIKAFSQDMLPADPTILSHEADRIREFPWHFASRILEATSYIAATPDLYPVLMTAFKCAPDSFLITHYKRIMEEHGKPYLILQMDEHDSNVGYESRIEAAVRAFRNHSVSGMRKYMQQRQTEAGYPRTIHARKNLAFPNWDPLVGPLLVNNLKRSGLNAYLLESNDLTLRKSMAYNTGQCIPINNIALEFIELMEKYSLRPEESMLWVPNSLWTCNIRMYQSYIQSMLEAYGKGMEKAAVYSGELSHLDISLNTCYRAYLAYLIGGLVRKAGCMIRPYELQEGATNHCIASGWEELKEAFLGRRELEPTVVRLARQLENIPVQHRYRPKVAIFGDLYVRDNDLMNQDLVGTIEKAGGEAITVPYNDYVKITASSMFRRRLAMGKTWEVLGTRPLLAGFSQLEKIYSRHFRKILGEMPMVRSSKYVSRLAEFRIHPLQSGESFDNLLKIFYIVDNYPDVSLFVQANPAFCCPSLVTEAMRGEIHRVTGVPVVSITYDGTHEFKNDVLYPYITFLTKSKKRLEKRYPL